MDRSVLYTNGICKRCVARRNAPYYDTWKELFGSIEKDATAVLNVGTDISKTFIPEEIADIASGRIFNYYSKRKSVIAFPLL